MRFAPLNIPLERRLQTLAIVVGINQAFAAFWIGTILSVYLVLYTKYYWVPLAYAAWFWYDYGVEERGGRRWNWWRNRVDGKWAASYFPVKLVKTAELPADRNYIFACHPHGILGFGFVFNFATEATGFSKQFPGIVPHVLTLKLNFLLPFYRELVIPFGFCSSSKGSIRSILNKKNKGNGVVVVVGGAREALDSHRGGDYVLILNSRKGFIKQALINGADLVPAFSFGENDVYDQINNPPGSWLRKMQETLKQRLSFSMPLINGRGIFQYSYGPLPYRSPVTCVVGSPIPVEKTEDPTPEQVDALHSRYIKELTGLFETHKAKYGDSSRKLIIK